VAHRLSQLVRPGEALARTPVVPRGPQAAELQRRLPLELAVARGARQLEDPLEVRERGEERAERSVSLRPGTVEGRRHRDVRLLRRVYGQREQARGGGRRLALQCPLAGLACGLESLVPPLGR